MPLDNKHFVDKLGVDELLDTENNRVVICYRKLSTTSSRLSKQS
jgi:hypothetical protein